MSTLERFHFLLSIRYTYVTECQWDPKMKASYLIGPGNGLHQPSTAVSSVGFNQSNRIWTSTAWISGKTAPTLIPIPRWAHVCMHVCDQGTRGKTRRTLWCISTKPPLDLEVIGVKVQTLDHDVSWCIHINNYNNNNNLKIPWWGYNRNFQAIEQLSITASFHTILTLENYKCPTCGVIIPCNLLQPQRKEHNKLNQNNGQFEW